LGDRVLNELLDLSGPNGSGIFACAIPDFDVIVLTQFLPLRLIGRNLDCPAAIQHSNFYQPQLVPYLRTRIAARAPHLRFHHMAVNSDLIIRHWTNFRFRGSPGLSVRSFFRWQRGIDVLLRKHDRFTAFLFTARHANYQKRCNDTDWYTYS
jgi:hypothetical protein